MLTKMIRTRFAPSPTGDLHIGGVRTALFSWLFARHHKGQFVLRIEDTDQSRSTTAATTHIIDHLDWLNLDYDEGPYFQSKRLQRYQTVVHQLLQEKKAYYCNCSMERLQTLKATQIAKKEKPKYDGLCRDKNLSSSVGNCVIRFKNAKVGEVIVNDQIIGPVKFQNSELDDFVLMRSDGSFTYNFSVIVDDNDMKITHIIRGNDHLNNTPRQMNVIRALNASVPVYMHLPMIHTARGKKLSKRDNASSITQYRQAGFLPEAILNYLARLGWSHQNQERFSRQELIDYFDGHHLSKSPAKLNESKLLWLNHMYLKEKDTSEVVELLAPFIKKWKYDSYEKPLLSEVIAVQKDRAETLKILSDNSRVFYETPIQVEAPLINVSRAVLELVYERLMQLNTWDKKSIYYILTRTIKCYKIQPKVLFQTLRLILLNSHVSPAIDVTITLLGRDRVLARLKYAIEKHGHVR